jgi:hypothetical protein
LAAMAGASSYFYMYIIYYMNFLYTWSPLEEFHH